MRFIDRLAFVLGANVRLEEAKAATAEYPRWALEGVGPYTQLPELHTVKNQLELMQRLSWVYNAVTITSQTEAGTPLSIKKRMGEDQEDIKNHPFELLLEKPNPMQSRFEFLEAWFAYRRLAGNAYVWLNRTSENEPPSEMWLIPPNRIRPVPDGKMFLRGYLYTPEDMGREIPIETWEICHTKRWHPTNMYVGLSPIEALANGVTADIKMQEWNKNYFAKDNAKMPGALAFKDMINDPDWKALQEEVAREYGGTKRRVMLLRGAGDSVSWLPFSMSQKDMEFLAGRNFNKEEIYAAFAPGLASVLAINATEANSVAGKGTFLSMTVWPDHQAIAEKITNDILPAYGPNLRAEFDDVRITDRALELQEQSAFGLVHTVDEVRKEYYQSDPLGDDRGGLLVPEVGKGLTKADEPAEPQPNPFQPALPSGEKPDDEEQKPEEEKSPKDVTPPDEPMKSELKAWERFAVKRVKDGKALREFESDDIPDALKGAIEGALVAAKTADDVRGIFRDALTWKAYP